VEKGRVIITRRTNKHNATPFQKLAAIMASHELLYLASSAAEVAIAAWVFYRLFEYVVKTVLNEENCGRWGVKRAARGDIACKSVSAVFAASATACGMVLITGGERRNSDKVDHILLVASGYFIYDVFAMFRVYEHENARKPSQKSSKSDFGFSEFVQFLRDKPLMMAHHLVIALFFIPLMMMHLSDHEPGDLMIACALIFEASTPFVSLRAILSNMNMKSSLIYLANGFLMVAVFFCCRILIFPWFYLVYGRSRGLTVLEAILSAPCKCSLFMLVVFLPQLHWFRLMVIGAMKVLRERNSAPVVNNGYNGKKHL